MARMAPTESKNELASETLETFEKRAEIAVNSEMKPIFLKFWLFLRNKPAAQAAGQIQPFSKIAVTFEPLKGF